MTVAFSGPHANREASEEPRGGQDKERQREFRFSEEDFQWVRRTVKETAGIELGDSKRDLAYGRIARRLRFLRLSSFQEYRRVVEGPQGDEEKVHLIEAITTNVTAFFREPHHFERVKREVVPSLRARGAPPFRLRAWSAGCSSGEEPYSLAMTLLEAFGEPASEEWDARILATDLDSTMIATGREGVYPEERVSALSKETLKRWFFKGKGPNKGLVQVRPEVRQIVSFRPLNLMHPWPMRGPFDLVFCRNVLIYFDRPTQEALIGRFVDLLAPGGFLFLGHSESVPSSIRSLRGLGKTSFVKAA